MQNSWSEPVPSPRHNLHVSSSVQSSVPRWGRLSRRQVPSLTSLFITPLVQAVPVMAHVRAPTVCSEPPVAPLPAQCGALGGSACTLCCPLAGDNTQTSAQGRQKHPKCSPVPKAKGKPSRDLAAVGLGRWVQAREQRDHRGFLSSHPQFQNSQERLHPAPSTGPGAAPRCCGAAGTAGGAGGELPRSAGIPCPPCVPYNSLLG